MLIDSHCHLDLLDLKLHGGDLSNVFRSAAQRGVTHFLCVGLNLKNFPKVLAIAEKYPNVYCSVGIHPSEKCEQENLQDELVKLSAHPKVVAIGETGLDYFYQPETAEEQQVLFRTHIEVARKTKKPLIIHSRETKGTIIDFLKSENAAEVGGVLHCFTDDWDTAKAALDLGFYISFSGIVTFGKAKSLQEVAKKVPLDRILVETDCPYLAPVPKRGKPNEPAYVRYTAEFLAQLRGISFVDFAHQTTDNFFECFHLKGVKSHFYASL